MRGLGFQGLVGSRGSGQDALATASPSWTAQSAHTEHDAPGFDGLDELRSAETAGLRGLVIRTTLFWADDLETGSDVGADVNKLCFECADRTYRETAPDLVGLINKRC